MAGRTTMRLPAVAPPEPASREPASGEPAPPPAPRALGEEGPRQVIALRVGVAVLVLGTVLVLWPFWPWLTLAAWFSVLARPMVERLASVAGGRRAAAAIATLLLFVLSLGPVIGIAVSLSADASQLVRDVSSTRSGRQALVAIVSSDAAALDRPTFDLHTLVQVLRAQGERTLQIASSIAGATADLVLGLFVFFTAAFSSLVDGPRAFAWLERHTPIAHRHAVRFADAFVETGRGLFVGIGLTGLVQAAIATSAYWALGVPRPVVLGMLTFVASFIPTIGTALVWGPVAIGLALTGREYEAAMLGIIGVLVVGTVDNLLRPVFARWGRLQMHTLVVLVSMLGGLAAIGGWGLLLGPLLLRLTLEGLRIAREEQLV
jgi:predicted PurR-regulated permease PerM